MTPEDKRSRLENYKELSQDPEVGLHEMLRHPEILWLITELEQAWAIESALVEELDCIKRIECHDCYSHLEATAALEAWSKAREAK